MTDPLTTPSKAPIIRQTVIDCPDVRALAEFYRELFDLRYRPGDEPPPSGQPYPHGEDWLVLRDADGSGRLAFQQVSDLPAPTWPEGSHPQMMHLDTTVPTVDDLHRQRERALALGALELLDRSADPDEPLFVFADLAGHPFCIFVAT